MTVPDTRWLVMQYSRLYCSTLLHWCVGLPLLLPAPRISGRGGRLRGPVGGLGLSGPVLGHLEGGGGNSSGGRRGGRGSGGGVRVGGPVLGVTAPVLLAGHGHLGLAGGLGSLLPLPLLLVSLLGVAVEEQVGHHLPRHVPGDGSPEPEDLPGQEPPHQTDAVGGLVVARDGNVHKLGGRVNVGKGDDGDVGVAGLSDRLVVGPGVGDKEQPGLLEGGLDLIGEGARGEAAGNGSGPDVSGKLKAGTLGKGPASDDEYVGGVLDGGDGPGGQDHLLPGLAKVDDVYTISPLLEDVLLHGGLGVVRTHVGRSSQHLSDVILGKGEGLYSSRHDLSTFLYLLREKRVTRATWSA